MTRFDERRTLTSLAPSDATIDPKILMVGLAKCQLLATRTLQRLLSMSGSDPERT